MPPAIPAPHSEEFEKPPELMDLSAHLVPPPAPPELPDMDDIKSLTESTIKMSGMFDSPEAGVAPPPPQLDDFGWSVNEPSIQPPPRSLDDGGTSFELDLRGPMPSLELEKPPEAPSFAPPRAARASTTAHSGELDETLREEIRAQLRKMLPDIAEKVIKEEIHRMLSEKF
jgi:hypothetical protein